MSEAQSPACMEARTVWISEEGFWMVMVERMSGMLATCTSVEHTSGGTADEKKLDAAPPPSSAHRRCIHSLPRSLP